jgi:hypothetical protein
MNLAESAIRDSFEADGYVAMPGFLDAAALATLNANLERYIRDIVPSLPPEHVFYEDKARPETLKQLRSKGSSVPICRCTRSSESTRSKSKASVSSAR